MANITVNPVAGRIGAEIERRRHLPPARRRRPSRPSSRRSTSGRSCSSGTSTSTTRRRSRSAASSGSSPTRTRTTTRRPRTLPGDLHGRPAPFRAAVRQRRRADSRPEVLLHQRLAHRRHPGDQPARRVDPARRRDPELRRRHHVHQPGRRLRGPVGAVPALRGHAARRAPVRRELVRAAAPGPVRLLRAHREELAGLPPPGGPGPPADRREGAVREPGLHRPHPRRVARSRAASSSATCSTRSPGPSTRCGSAGQPGSVAFWDNRATVAPRPAGPRPPRRGARAAPGHADRRGAGRPRRPRVGPDRGHPLRVASRCSRRRALAS